MFIPRAISTIAATLGSGIILPLYFHPTADCSAWTPIIDAVTSHPTLPFVFVVNPDNGPGAAEQPDSSYQACIPHLKADNTRVVGYVHTMRGESIDEDVQRNITLYAGWEAEYRPDGIFFDDAPTTTDEVVIAELRNQTDLARGAFADFIILNPGTTPLTPLYYTFSDLIVTAESNFGEFDISAIEISTDQPANHQAVILHSAPVVEAPYSALVTQLVDAESGGFGLGFVLITETEDYSTLSANWGALIDTVEAAAA